MSSSKEISMIGGERRNFFHVRNLLGERRIPNVSLKHWNLICEHKNKQLICFWKKLWSLLFWILLCLVPLFLSRFFLLGFSIQEEPITHTAPVISMRDEQSLMLQENCDSETVSNETDPGDSLLSSPASLTAPVPAMDGVNHYNWNCVIFKSIVQQWGGRWEAVTEVRNLWREFLWERMFAQRSLKQRTENV